MPRLEKFMAQFPDIHVTIDTSHRLVDLTLDGFDIAIRYTSINKPASNWTLLVVETLQPVCSPSFKEKLGVPWDAKLLGVPLIHVTSVSSDWAHWFRANGIEMPASSEGGLRVDNMQMGLDAAILGLGVVLGRSPLIDEEIKSGRLVRLGAGTIPSDSGYWLVTSQPDLQKPEVRQFRHWLLSELGVGVEHRKSVRSASRTTQSIGRTRPVHTRVS
jgi:LysR family glycine cleavage system transcriptional activator